MQKIIIKPVILLFLPLSNLCHEANNTNAIVWEVSLRSSPIILQYKK